MKLRILQVAPYYPPALSFGGPPQVMFDLGKELIAKGHYVSVYTTDAISIEDWKARIDKKDDEINGIKVKRFSRRKYSDKLPTGFLKLVVAGVDEQCAQDMGNFDIVHIASVTHPLALKCSAWASKHNIPYVISLFGNLSPFKNPAPQALRGAFLYLWGRKMLKNAAALLVQNPHESELCSQYTSKDKIITLPLPVDTALFQNLPSRGKFRQKYKIGDTEKVILFLGRIHLYKGIRFLVEASAGLLKKKSGNYRLVIAGSDEGYKKSLTGRIQELGIEEKVIFTGSIFGRAKLEAYVDANVFAITPITYEETSLAALEACACGTPVIVTDHNAIPKLTEYEAGFQIRYDRKELENALVKILDNRELREKMGRNAKRLIEQEYALKIVVDKLESIFVNIVQNKVR